MKISISKKIILAATITLMAGAIAYAGKSGRAVRPIPPTPIMVSDRPKDLDPINTEILAELISKVNPSSKNYVVSGWVSYRDGADSLSAMDMPCISVRKGSDFYYRLGETETIQEKGTNICIDNKLRKIVLYKGTPAKFSLLQIPADSLGHYLESEGYKVSIERLSDRESKIAVVNPNHISCKAFSITFLTQGRIPLVYSSTLNNPNDPTNGRLDREVCFKMDHSTTSGDSLLLVSRVVIGKKGGETRLTSAYSSYELLDMR